MNSLYGISLVVYFNHYNNCEIFILSSKVSTSGDQEENKCSLPDMYFVFSAYEMHIAL